MKLAMIVCGDREWQDAEAVADALDTLQPDLVIEGEARGADTLAREHCQKRGILVERFLADWGRYGKGAGPVRNRKMLERLIELRVVEGYEVIVLGFHNSLHLSRGTADMLKQAAAAGVPSRLYAEGVLND